MGHGDAGAGPRDAERIEARLNGVAHNLTTRVLAGRGWTVAAMTTPGGLGAFISGSAAEYNDRIVPLGQAIGVDEAPILQEIGGDLDEPPRNAALARVLEQSVDPQRIGPARRVAAVARLAETDRSLRRLDELCAQANIGQRTIQRLFRQFAGVSPTWVLRRYRLLEAAEAVRAGERVSWVDIAAELGYADQAHLIRDFRAATGQTPAAYAAAQPSS